MADPTASLTVRLAAPSNQRWSGTFPVEVRDCDRLVLTARGVSGGKLVLPAGRYFISASLPNGQQAAADDIVDLKPGDDKEVQVVVSDADFPATLQNTTTLGDSVREFVRPVTQYFSAQNVAIVRGNWLAAKIGIDPASPVAREPTARSSIEVKFSEVHAWIEIATSSGCCYLAVPVDKERSTTVQWRFGTNSDALELRFDFNDGELNSFFDFIQNDQTLEARSISHSIVLQSEQFLDDKSKSPLRAILGAYVLLRANELEYMDNCSRNLANMYPWLPDTLAVRVEYLARNGEHSEALRLLLDVPKWGTPWFRSGVGYLEKRAKIYANVVNAKPSDLQIADADLKKLQRIAGVFSELASSLDMRQSTTALRGMARLI